jgi:hypothetical protein
MMMILTCWPSFLPVKKARRAGQNSRDNLSCVAHTASSEKPHYQCDARQYLLYIHKQASSKSLHLSIYHSFIHSSLQPSLCLDLPCLLGPHAPLPVRPLPRLHRELIYTHSRSESFALPYKPFSQSVSQSVRGHCRTKDSHRQLARNYILRRIFLLYMAVYKAHLFRHLGRIINR